ncbi:MAG: ABC transporter ATP-binding protein [Arcanobacterium sp.]|nr:ABC transporter ATP-binding protein [Arcanobacterium sp.]
MRLPVASRKTIWRKLRELLNLYRWELLVTIALQLVVAIAAVLTPWIIGTTIDLVVKGAEYERVLQNILFLGISVAIQAIVTWIADFRARALGQKILHVLRVDLVQAVSALPLSAVERAGTGDLLGRTTTDVDRIEFILRVGISKIITLSFTVVITVAAGLVVNWRLGLIILLVFVPFAYVLRIYLRRAIPAYSAYSALRAELSGEITETVEQAETVDMLSMTKYRRARVFAMFDEMWLNDRYTSWTRVRLFFQTALILFSPILLVVVLGSIFIGWGVATIGAVSTIVMYAVQIRYPIEELGFWADEFAYTAIAFGRIFGVNEVPNEREFTTEVPNDSGIVAKDLNFAYVEDRPVLREVNFSIKPGEQIALVGPSGAGKSTLGRIIAGTAVPTSGSLQVGGVDIALLPDEILKKTVALVTQENHVFTGTLGDNLRLAKQSATDEELLAALAAVEASWISELADGLETKLGSGALELAPDQAQHLALARIILLDPQVLVLDEATSLLDPRAARSAERALSRVMEGRTVVSIAHRLYTAYDADRVAVMIDGQIAEFGTHQELVALGKEYAALWASWQQG